MINLVASQKGEPIAIYGRIERQYAKVLLDPFEEQFDLPPLLVDLGDHGGRQMSDIGDGSIATPGIAVVEANAAERLDAQRA